MLPVGWEHMKMVGDGSEKLLEWWSQGLAGRGDTQCVPCLQFRSVESLLRNLVGKPKLVRVGYRSRRTKRT